MSISYLSQTDISQSDNCIISYNVISLKILRKCKKLHKEGVLLILMNHDIPKNLDIESYKKNIKIRLFTLQVFDFKIRSEADKNAFLLVDKIYNELE